MVLANKAGTVSEVRARVHGNKSDIQPEGQVTRREHSLFVLRRV